MEGWIKKHRKILDHYLFKENRVFSKYEAWDYILLMANHKDSKFLLGNELIEVKAGQLITSQSKLMDKFKWSKSKLKGFFSLLESDGMLKVFTDSKKTTLTVVKYRDYQEQETANSPQKDRKQSANSLRIDTNKNVKNDNNVKNEKKDIESSFEIFWNLYDKKVDRKKSFEKWKNLKQSERDEIIEKTPAYVKANSDPQFRKNPVTFFNNRSWEDEIIKVKKNNTNGRTTPKSNFY